MMVIARALVIYKQSLYQIYVKRHKERAIKEAIERRDPLAQRFIESDRIQHDALKMVKRVLRARGIAFEMRWRGRLRTTKDVDLVITVGGDGTLLDTAHWIRDKTPLLGINSNPGSSVGKLCAGTAEELDLILARIVSGKLKPRHSPRLRVQIDGQEVLKPCLNDLLLAHRSPAELSRFQMARLTQEEAATVANIDYSIHWPVCRSSGIWVSTAIGSTAAIRSAGGKRMSPRSTQLQFLVREPYVTHSDRVDGTRAPIGGFVEPGQALILINRMRSARLWGDGPHHSVKVDYGDRIVVDHHPDQALLFVRRYRDKG